VFGRAAVWSPSARPLQGVRLASQVALNIERTASPRTFVLVGEVDVSNAGVLSATLDPVLGADGNVTLDLAGVAFMDSTGISVLMNAARALAHRGMLRLVSPGPLVHNVLKLIGAESLPNVQILNGQGG
jgi:anti-anti-sigma factor